ncbi:MAG TPA: iron-sulfur cluster repair di-iron protein [Armatimonadetes bacterium]|nr:iron-sulfur cluster repair di-iron protein [Armatimonadota bacterium]
MAELDLTPETKVSEVAAHYPAVLRTLEALGIDYCCGGNRTLAEASQSAGMPVERVVAVLKAAITQSAGAPESERRWVQAPLDELMKHILETHHAYTHAELPRLQEMLTLVNQVHGERYGELLVPLQEKFLLLKGELEAHLRKEEEAVFPAVAALLAGRKNGTVAQGIEELESEHDGAGDLLKEMRQITGDYRVPKGVCTTYEALYRGLQELEADLHRHIHLENNVLFPRARELRSAA